MGIISKAALEGGGEVTGVVPWAMIKAGGEGDKGANVEKGGKEKIWHVVLDEKGMEKVRDRLFSRTVLIHVCCIGQYGTSVHIYFWRELKQLMLAVGIDRRRLNA